MFFLLSFSFWFKTSDITIFLKNSFRTIAYVESGIFDIALCLKKISQKLTIFVFGNTKFHQTFTEYFLINTHILICQMWLQAIEHPLNWLRFFGYFLYIIDDHSCLNSCISIKLWQIVSMINIYNLVCQHSY